MDALPLSARLLIHAVIRTKGNTNIINSLVRICDTDKSSTAKVRRVKNTYKRKCSSYVLQNGALLTYHYLFHIKISYHSGLCLKYLFHDLNPSIDGYAISLRNVSTSLLKLDY